MERGNMPLRNEKKIRSLGIRRLGELRAVSLSAVIGVDP